MEEIGYASLNPIASEVRQRKSSKRGGHQAMGGRHGVLPSVCACSGYSPMVAPRLFEISKKAILEHLDRSPSAKPDGTCE